MSKRKHSLESLEIRSTYEIQKDTLNLTPFNTLFIIENFHRRLLQFLCLN